MNKYRSLQKQFPKYFLNRCLNRHHRILSTKPCGLHVRYSNRVDSDDVDISDAKAISQYYRNLGDKTRMHHYEMIHVPQSELQVCHALIFNFLNIFIFYFLNIRIVGMDLNLELFSLILTFVVCVRVEE